MVEFWRELSPWLADGYLLSVSHVVEPGNDADASATGRRGLGGFPGWEACATAQGLHSEGVYLIERHLKSLNNMGALVFVEGKGRKWGWTRGKSGRTILNIGLSKPHS